MSASRRPVEIARSAPNVSRETFERLELYVALLSKWTVAINLVSTSDRDVLWSRHVQDSLRLVPLIPPGAARGIDLGSGAGLPGLVLALATGLLFDLVEADRRKAAFLHEAARLTGAPVTIRCQRIEAGGIAAAPLVTARALAPLPRLLAYAHAVLQAGGTCLFPKGADAERELAGCTEWRMRVERFKAAESAGSVVLRITGLTHA